MTSNIRLACLLATAGVVQIAGCGRAERLDRDLSARDYEHTDSMGSPVAGIVTIPPHWSEDLVENSAAAMSRSQPGIWFTINDSGNDPLLFALDTAGADRGVWRIRGARNVDWESLSPGPCGQRAAGSCLYIGDTGDNDARYATRTIYRVLEPTARAPGARDSLGTEALTYSYADGPHDVEAMFAAPNGDVWLITKRKLQTKQGRSRDALVFRLPASAWGHAPAVAALVDSVPIVPGSAPMRLITDAALSPNGRRLAVRTYAQAYVFATDSATGRIDHATPPAVCNLIGLDEAQGEGIAWVDDQRLLFTTEGVTEPAHIARCPLPGAPTPR